MEENKKSSTTSTTCTSTTQNPEYLQYLKEKRELELAEEKVMLEGLLDKELWQLPHVNPDNFRDYIWYDACIKAMKALKRQILEEQSLKLNVTNKEAEKAGAKLIEALYELNLGHLLDD